ncbi:MAG: hypothetical protein HYR64_06480 [Fimbriimonas ginsengisoli]|uniref:Uncharacterized protein n=1 Tax=Fimbriimonas ginsengisoli TaxID=1005039 RepID=A0A931PWK4_FIMGI|nr:hypothetical protein [Fimbriimonas ginsengisoli]
MEDLEERFTQDWIKREWLRRLRAMTPAERLAVALDRTEMGLEIAGARGGNGTLLL